jgi:hypothetical protein
MRWDADYSPNAEIFSPCATRISFKAYQTLEPSRSLSLA